MTRVSDICLKVLREQCADPGVCNKNELIDKGNESATGVNDPKSIT